MTAKTAKDYPHAIPNIPQNARALAHLFSYKAREYDLDAYEAIQPGLGRYLWESFLKEKEHLNNIDARRAKLDDRYNALYRPFGIFRFFEI